MLRILWLGLVATAATQATGPLVETTYGTVRGRYHEAGGYSSFTGIRYGTIPTGRDRFKGPLPPAPWDDIFDADQNDIACPQMSTTGLTGIDDCLSLNVFTPDYASSSNPVPVIVFVHGGANIFGSNGHISPEHLMPHNVVLVVINFRVSILGLLCLKHEMVPGNAGYKDQVAALRWVQQNIAAFGGDPDNVTLMGHSSGSVASDLLSLSPLTEGLIHRSILLSGTARSFWAVNVDPVERAETMARTHLDYEGNSIEELVELYLNTDNEALLSATVQEFVASGDGSLPVAACVEQTFPGVEAFLPDTPVNILASGLYISMPSIFVVTNNEFVNMVNPSSISNIPNLKENFQDYLPADLIFQSEAVRILSANRIRDFYFNGERTDLEAYIAFNSDTLFYHGAVRGAYERRATSTAPVFFLEFTYESQYRQPRLPEAADMPGVGHGDELFFLLNAIPDDVTITDADRITIARFTTLFSNFAKHGNPTPDINDLQWLPIADNLFHYLNLGSEILSLQSPNAEAVALWDQVYTEVATPVVQTAQGLVRGTHHPSESYTSFTGIRYAAVPSGRDRFKGPLPPAPWDDIFDADQNDIACPHIWMAGLTGIDDCLSLNVFTPDYASSSNPVPVIVFVHGGANIFGSNGDISPELLLPHNVVLVAINYRVSILGLLCLKHEMVPGNAGYKDQVAALRWVQQNIAAFGGDPDNITLMGHSSGSVAVDLLTLSPLTEGLIHRSILMSGTARSFWAVNVDPVERAETMARTHLGYEGNSIEELVELYLNTDNAALLLATFQEFGASGDGSMPIAACVEQPFPGVEAFLTDTPANILASGLYISIPSIVTVTNNEFVNMVNPSAISNIPHMKENFQDYLPADVILHSDAERMIIANRIRDFYFNGERSDLEAYIAFMSDTLFYHGAVRGADERRATSTQPVFFLEFTYESEYRSPRLPETVDMPGVGHGDEAIFLLNAIPDDVTITDADRLTIARFTTLFANFAQYGNPTPDINDLQWLPLAENLFHYLNLGSEILTLQSPNAEAVALWDQVYAEVAIPVVQTAQGLVRGTHHPSESYTSFTGIRYATVPSGRDRFKGPAGPPSWEGVFDANENNIICPQISTEGYIGTEDCLALNVYSPDAASQTNPLPVIVYIHGGYFFIGSNTMYGPDQLMTQDAVLVIINYRLGALGLVCLGHELIPGNAAFKDQVAALNWVKQNIAAFGGDPDNVTIMGHSAGGASVDLLTLSSMTEGLFNKAITISASARAFWALNSDPVERATAMARTFMGYNGDSIEDLVQFFLNADAEALALATVQYFATIADGSLPFAACVEDTFETVDGFLTDSPENILASGEYISVPKVYGVANKEYINMLLPTDVTNAPQVMNNVENILPTDLIFASNAQRTNVANRLREFYITDERSALEGYIDFMSDTMFYHAVVRAIRERQATTSEPIYVFEFTYESELRFPRLPEVSDLTGAGHIDDVFHLIFPVPEGIPVSEEDRLMKDRYTTLITNFATYGNPTPQTSELLQVIWPLVTADRLDYLDIGSELVIRHTPNEAAIALWDEIYAEVAAGSSSSRLLSSIFVFCIGASALILLV